MFSQSKILDDNLFVKIPEGDYRVGRKGYINNPSRRVTVDAFYISKYEITNKQFEKFVEATKYKTDAEKLKNAMVFEPGLKEFRWIQDSTAYWRYPNGVSRGGIEGKMNHPVTTISYKDALAYCNWAGVRLPTFNEWEIASRAGSETEYFWGEDSGELINYANVWHGQDHLTADTSDGYVTTSPVGSFEPNPWDIYDIYGNVFELTEGKLPKEKRKYAHARGGSWWCSSKSCNFFNSVDIGRVNTRASFSNLGFRVCKDAEEEEEL
jgi:sulfatase modifying factor 1